MRRGWRSPSPVRTSISAPTWSPGALDRLLRLTVGVSGFAALTVDDPLLDRLAGGLRGLRPPRPPAVFEALISGIVWQQLSLTVGTYPLNRLIAACGWPVAGNPDGVDAFSVPEDIASAAPGVLRAIGFSLAKARTVL
jgi:3-methyladenine DNA glycosylase/8-oxoguanine DNA glycosylase